MRYVADLTRKWQRYSVDGYRANDFVNLDEAVEEGIREAVREALTDTAQMTRTCDIAVGSEASECIARAIERMRDE